MKLRVCLLSARKSWPIRCRSHWEAPPQYLPATSAHSGPVWLLSVKIGKDNFADVVLSSLEGKNVDTSRIIRSESLATGATIVLNYDQDRANVTYPGAMNDLRIEDIDIEFLSRARHMHFANCFMQPGIRKDLTKLFRIAKGAGTHYFTRYTMGP